MTAVCCRRSSLWRSSRASLRASSTPGSATRTFARFLALFRSSSSSFSCAVRFGILSARPGVQVRFPCASKKTHTAAFLYVKTVHSLPLVLTKSL
eukprot:2171834-Rhodomonas_salina.1